MSFIQKLFKPKWQHSDPEVRKQALLSLAGDDAQEIYRNIIENEAELEVLNIALKRITDFDTLLSISESDKNRKLRAQAIELAAKMLCGTHASTPPANKRISIISTLENKSLLEEVAKHADLEELRRIALTRLDKASLWMEAASNESNQQLKDLALEHINDKSALERLISNTKRKDKYINRLAKEKLQNIIDLENAPLIAADKRRSLIQAVNRLGLGKNWETDQVSLQDIKTQWNDISYPETEELQHDYNNAIQKFEAGYSEWQKQLAEESRNNALELELHTANAASLLKQYNELDSTLKNDNAHERVPELKAELHTLDKQLETLKKVAGLNIQQQLAMSENLAHVLKQVEQNKQQTRLLHDIQNELSRFKSYNSQSEKHLQRTIKKRKQIAESENLEINNALSVIDKQISTIEKEIQRQREQTSSLQTKLSDEMKSLGKLIEQGQSQLIGEAMKQIQTKLDKLERLSPDSVEKLNNQFKSLSLQAKELTDWKNWVASPKKDELIKEMQGLVGITFDPHDLAQRIQKARDEWKRLGNSGRPEDIALWEKFNQACNLAYAPCQEAFNKETIKRSENGAARQTFINTLRTFIEHADWEHIDWKQVEKLLRDSRTEWKEFGATERSLYKSLNEQFFELTGILHTRIQAHWDENLALKQSLVEKARQLAQNEDVNQAINQAKDLQAEWSNAGRVSQKDEKQLWKKFRTELDALFNKRKNISSEKRNQEQQSESQKTTIISRLGKLAALDRSTLLNSKPEFKQLKLEWLELGNSGKNERQLQNSHRDAEKHYLAQLARAEKQQQYLQLFELGRDLGPDELKLMHLSELAELVTNSRQIQSQNEIQKQQNLCLMQLEILFEIESPAEYKGERMGYQIEQINLGLGRNNDRDDWLSFLSLEAKWQWLTLHAAKPDSQQLQRHEKIIAVAQQKHSDTLAGI